MLRLNLIRQPVRPAFPWQWPVIIVLALFLMGQSLISISTWLTRSRHDKEARSLQVRLDDLEQQLEQTSNPPGDLSKLAGELIDRNRWVESRLRTPVTVLAKLDQGNKPGLHLLSFEGKTSGGSLRLLAADMDSASRFLQEIFHSNTDRLVLETRAPEGLILGYTWTD